MYGKMKGENVMSIGKIFGSMMGSHVVKSAVNFTKKNPLIVAGGLGVVGLIGYKAVTTSRKQQTEAMNQLYLSNPFINPFGWFQHALNPKLKPNALDGPLVNYVVERNNENCNKYSTPDEIKEYYKNGGKGVIFNSAA